HARPEAGESCTRGQSGVAVEAPIAATASSQLMNPDESFRLALIEPVRLVPYDSRWRDRFDAEHQRLIACIGTHVAQICHFGSTSVFGMAAKPTIDVIAGLHDMGAADEVLRQLCECGYSYASELDLGTPG